MRRLSILATALLGSALLTTTGVGPVAAADGQPIGGPSMASKGTLVDYSGGASKLPQVLAASWVVADADTGEILAAKAPHLRHRPASTLKTLTAVTLLPMLAKSTVYTTVDGDVNVEGSRAGLVPNAPYTIDQLFYGMFLPSGNDAATALARAAGSIKGTVALMNARAQTLQALDTTVVNPTGLDADGQYSSAYDLALILRAGVARTDFRRYIGTLEHPLPGKVPPKGHKRKTFQLWNQDRLLQQGYPGLIGGKTGWTTLAGRTFVAATQRGGHTLIVTLMGIKEPSADAARALFAWGFHNVTKAKPVGVLVDPVKPGSPAPAASPSPSASPAVAAAGAGAPLAAVVPKQPSSGSSRHTLLIGAGVLLVLAGLIVAVRPLFGRRRRASEHERLMAVGKRWSS